MPRFLSHIRLFRGFALKARGFNPGAHRFDFDALARELAGGMSRREALRRFGIGLTAAFLADVTGLMPWAPAERAAADPMVPTLHCSSAQAAACVAGIVQQAAGAFQACAGVPGSGNPAPDLLPQLQGILAGEVDPGELQPWLRATGMLYCFDIALNEAHTFQQSCLGPGAGCGAGTACSNNYCCPTGLIGCGGLCLDTLSDPNNCGADPATACGHRCAAGESCAGGDCKCGSGPACGAGQTCVNGVCTGGAGSTPDTGQGSTAGGQSNGGAVCSETCAGCCDIGVCLSYDLQSNSLCGSGGRPCGKCDPGKICFGGNCCLPDSTGRSCCPAAQICKGHASLLGGGLTGLGQTVYNCCQAGDVCLDRDATCCPMSRLCQAKTGGAQTCCGPNEQCDNQGNCCSSGVMCTFAGGKMCCQTGQCCDPISGCMAGDSPQHCGPEGGACRNCGPDVDCVNGQCQPSSCHCSGARPSSAFTCCCCLGQANGLWVNLQSGLDPNGHSTGPGFCGSCSTSCASEAVCMNGTCRCPKGSMQVCTDKPCNTSLSFKYCDDSGACMGG